MNIPSSMKDALSKPQKTTDSTIVMKGKIDKNKVDNPAVSSSKVENPAALSLASSSSSSSKGNNTFYFIHYITLHDYIMMIEINTEHTHTQNHVDFLDVRLLDLNIYIIL